MAILGIALLAWLFIAIIGKRAAQTLLKGAGIAVGLIVVYLAVGSQIMNHMHPTAPPPVAVLTPEQIASDHSGLVIAIFMGALLLFCVVRFAYATREPHGPSRRLGH